MNGIHAMSDILSNVTSLQVNHTHIVSNSRTLVVPTIKDLGEQESMMTERDHMYLESHNRRRIDWHARYNKEYIPLKWSKGKYFQM